MPLMSSEKLQKNYLKRLDYKMKSHELAKALSQLSSILLASPNIDMNQLQLSQSSNKLQLSNDGVEFSLHTLANLSRLDKQQWLSIINNNGFMIDIRPRDASRDILGKLLRHLEENKTARDVLKNKIAKREAIASPELMKALGTLLKD